MAMTLILGGARSGKSRLAQQMAERHCGRLCFIATAEAIDPEMASRIARHQSDRGQRWHTVEAPVALAEAIARAGDGNGAILVDCLTVWLGNLMHHGHDIEAAVQQLIAACHSVQVPLLLVSNEVGQGIVPDNVMARTFRDLAGRLHQDIAAAANSVWFVTAGLPQRLKGQATDASQRRSGD